MGWYTIESEAIPVSTGLGGLVTEGLPRVSPAPPAFDESERWPAQR
jgi:hypothetical protein